MLNKGSTLIETIVAISIFLVAILGIINLLKISATVATDNKAKLNAIAIATEKMEKLRSMDYDSLGTVGGIPPGSIPQVEHETRNSVDYTIRTAIYYVDSPADGEGVNDQNSIQSDYKKAKITVSWQGKVQKQVSLVSTFAPPYTETQNGGGVLEIYALDANVQPIQDAQVHIENTNTNPVIDTILYTNNEGKVTVPGTPASSGYKITVTKPNFSVDKTYDSTAQNPNPNPGHLTVATSSVTSKHFFIDLLSNLTLKTFKKAQELIWQDNFDDATKIASSTNTQIVNGFLQLKQEQSGFAQNGIVISTSTQPEFLSAWKQANAVFEAPTSTTVVFQIYDDSGSLVPETQLPGNSSGFTNMPIDLSSISTSSYPALSLKATLTTSATDTTPKIDSWQISYVQGPIPLGNIPLSVRGEKTIGENNGTPIYKFSTTTQTDTTGQRALNNIEWDTYHIKEQSPEYTAQEICPPDPFYLAPNSDASLAVILATSTPNSLRVTVKESSGATIEGALLTLMRPGLTATSTTSNCGQTLFENLPSATDYTLTTAKPGYATSTVSNITVSGESSIDIILQNN